MNLTIPRIAALTAALSAAAAVHAAEPAPAAKGADMTCFVGAYRLDDGGSVTLGRIDDPAALRWRLLDGRTGKLVRKDGALVSTGGWGDRADGVKVELGQCGEPIVFEGHRGERIKFDIVDTAFEGAGVKLRGRLVLPAGRDKVPVVVMVHGSENYSGVDLYYQQHLFPTEGVGVFVYDKRGTGGSTGKYTQNFHELSDDAAAALREAQRLGGERVSKIGYLGGSQGGWIAPLAASKTPQAQFVEVGFGLADGVLAEDRDQVVLDLRAAGFGDKATLRKARELTDATGLIASSNGARGWTELDAVRKKYEKDTWWKSVKGEYSGLVATHTRDEVMAEFKKYDYEVSWDYDPMPVLRTLKTPQLWVLGGDDIEAPSEETQKRLTALGRAGRPITTVVFPQADHGILEFEKDAKGERTHTRTADGYLRMLLDWIKRGQLDGWPYGTAKQLAGPK
ncbi:alpha/beta hydrolase [Lysobacter sp. K5869]|uniref:alpha/beta hydrolase family protein n=1 Tax=Lysobacter sp. K5869 TaxID=2820808 RepID=UPI001C06081D|nr:alpha/beta hydrolase [Lysobacter sp. K5869]QWP77741.1 alpha/beta hydrolase [Lysobacter sp. K5869]